ncbi:UPF0481 protein [Cinnamomum micranthum f. kanehirae]|uniref:UPF0481 protein n=1 Tax=Cinnamomum micranthum f. kanehirae TaxID=337451 RepID=A0A443NV94_9MAGN|nr:UPF0481 protein [Cinnamomum micranthum f. kanehirae]
MEESNDIEGEAHQAKSNQDADTPLVGDFFTGIEEKEDERVKREKEEFKQEYKRLSTSIKLKMKEDIPSQQDQQAESSTICIYRAPESLLLENGDKRRDFDPQIVSIGPYHYGKEELQKMEKHKWGYLRSLLNRTRGGGIKMINYVKAMMKLEKSARSCYAEYSNLSREEFVQMMLLDGCFVLELLRKFSWIIRTDEDDPIFTMPWIVPFLMRDLLKLENQLPFFVLECLFSLSNVAPHDKQLSLAELVCLFLDRAMLKPMKVINRCPHNPKHLLDFIRSSFLPVENTWGEFIPVNLHTPHLSWGAVGNEYEEMRREIHPLDLEMQQRPKRWADMIPCANKLRVAGIKFKAVKKASKLLKFKNRVLEIPPIAIDHCAASFLLNCIAFEQCYSYCSKHFSTYAILMDLLIKSVRDVAILCDSKIINNYYGSEEDLAQFFNAFGKVIAVDVRNSHLFSELEKINQYYKNNWNEFRTSFMDTYFSSPWVFLSALAAFILLLLTLIQTFFAVLSYVRPPS